MLCESIELNNRRYVPEEPEFFEIINNIIGADPILSRNSYFISNGKICGNSIFFEESAHVRIVPRILGGKGGFGTLLKTMGSRMGPIANQDSCRDLEGRRMRDVKNSKKYLVFDIEFLNGMRKIQNRKL